MVKNLVGILISFLLIFGVSAYELIKVNAVFDDFTERLLSLYNKAEDKTATYEDGYALRSYWNEQKKFLHVWIPHTSIENVDYQLNEAVGYLYEGQFEDVVPKLEVLMEISEKIPRSYAFSFENIF